MSDLQTPNVQRPQTPEERSHARDAVDPVDSTPKFELNKVAWFTLPRKGASEVTIVDRKKENGKFLYQIKGSDGILYKKGEWVEQKRLSEA